MKLTEKRLSGKTVYDGEIIKVELDEVELPDGSKSKRECVRHSGGAAVLCVHDGSILLVKQFRYLYGKEIYEIPAGKLEKGEDPACAAARELREETGYAAELEPFLKIYPTPGYTDEVIHVFLAKSSKKTGGVSLDEGEFVDTVLIPIEKTLEMIERGEITDGKTVAAIYKFLFKEKTAK